MSPDQVASSPRPSPPAGEEREKRQQCNAKHLLAGGPEGKPQFLRHRLVTGMAKALHLCGVLKGKRGQPTVINHDHCRLRPDGRAGKAGTGPRSPKPRRTLGCGGTTPLLLHVSQAQDAVAFIILISED